MQSQYQVLGDYVDDNAPTLRMARAAAETTVIIRRRRRAPRSRAWAAVGMTIIVVLVAFVGAASAHVALIPFR